MRRSHTKQAEVTYRDMDPAGHVSCVVYYSYMLTSYNLFMRDLLSIPLSKPVPQVMVKTSCEYKYPAKFGDMLEIETSVVRFGNKSFDIEYAMYLRGDERKLVAAGASTHVMLDHHTETPIPLTEEFKRRVVAYQGEV